MHIKIQESSSMRLGWVEWKLLSPPCTHGRVESCYVESLFFHVFFKKLHWNFSRKVLQCWNTRKGNSKWSSCVNDRFINSRPSILTPDFLKNVQHSSTSLIVTFHMFSQIMETLWEFFEHQFISENMWPPRSLDLTTLHIFSENRTEHTGTNFKIKFQRFLNHSF